MKNRISGMVQVDRDHSNALSREEMQQALAYRGLELKDEEVTSLMAFLDTQRRGYVTFRDLDDSIKAVRLLQQRPQANGSETTTALPLPPPPNGTTTTRLGTALLTPVVLCATTVPIKGPKRRRHKTTGQASGGRESGWEAGLDCLDITDEEIKSLADHLVGLNGDESSNGIDHSATNTGDETSAKENKENGGGERASSEDDVASCKGIGHVQSVPLSDADARPQSTQGGHYERVRSLSVVMATLEAAASRAGVNSVRGSGAAAVPSSAARVVEILGGLERLWRHSNHRHGIKRKNPPPQPDPDGFSDEELNAAVRVFDLDGSGQMQLDDVIAAFRCVRADRFAERRPPSAVMPTLTAIERHLHERGITAVSFVQEAAAFTIKDVAPVSSYRPSEGSPLTGGDGGKAICGRKKAQFGQPATTWQVGALLVRDVGLTTQKRDRVLECVSENGLVWGAHLSRVMRRARREREHRHLDRLEQERSKGSDTWRYTSGETDSDTPLINSSAAGEEAVVSPPRHQQSATVEGKMETTDSIERQRKQGSQNGQAVHRGIFDQFDASLILDLFAREGRGLRSLTAEDAVAVWRGLKRRDHGVHAYEAGRSAARDFQQLLRHLTIKPLQWFGTLGAASEGGGDSLGERRVPLTSVVAGVRLLVVKARKTIEETSGGDQARSKGFTVEDSSEGDQPKTHQDGADTSLKLLAGDKPDWIKWDEKRLSALAQHLDPCGKGSITRLTFEEGLRDCRGGGVVYPDVNQLDAARRFEVALRMTGCKDVCGLIRTLMSGGRGGGSFFEYVKQIGNGPQTDSQELNTSTKEKLACARAARVQVGRRAFDYLRYCCHS